MNPIEVKISERSDANQNGLENSISENQKVPASISPGSLFASAVAAIGMFGLSAVHAQAAESKFTIEANGYVFGKTVFVDPSCKFTVKSDYMSTKEITGHDRAPLIHDGLDISLNNNFNAAKGTSIKSPGYGEVWEVGKTIHGNSLLVRQPTGYKSRTGQELFNVIAFYHLNDVLVKVGDPVGPTEEFPPVATMGNTGTGVGTHLHLGYYENVAKVIKIEDSKFGLKGIAHSFQDGNGRNVRHTNPHKKWYNPGGNSPLVIPYFEPGKGYSKETLNGQWLWAILGDCTHKKTSSK